MIQKSQTIKKEREKKKLFCKRRKGEDKFEYEYEIEMKEFV